jgi:hypothetical protein
MGALNVTDDAKTQVRMSEENRTEQAGKSEEQDKRATSGYRKLDSLNITRNCRRKRLQGSIVSWQIWLVSL